MIGNCCWIHSYVGKGIEGAMHVVGCNPDRRGFPCLSRQKTLVQCLCIDTKVVFGAITPYESNINLKGNECMMSMGGNCLGSKGKRHKRLLFLHVPKASGNNNVNPEFNDEGGDEKVAKPPKNVFGDLFGSFLGNIGSARSEESNSLDEEQEDEGGKFVPLEYGSSGSLTGEGEGTFGPLAVLGVGLLQEEISTMRQLLDELGAHEVDLIPCSKKMLDGTRTLGEALVEYSKIQNESSEESSMIENFGMKRVVFLSGFYSSEIIDIVGAMRESEIAPGVAFAAVVPKSWDRPLVEVVDDVYADHAEIAQQRAAARLAAAQNEQEFEAQQED